MNRTDGFSLIELIIVMTIIAILAAIALPSYRQHVLRSHRIDATRTLQDIASRQERFHFSNNRYSGTLDALGSTESAAGVYYTLGIAAAGSTDYTITATAVGAQTRDDSCESISLTRAGMQQSTGTGETTACWGALK